MENKTILLFRTGADNYSVRTIGQADIELLREWKNANRESFFFRKIITPEMQEEWFKSYQQRENDFMLVIVNNSERVGCIGFRRLKDRIDLYNLIVGKTEDAGKGNMSGALDLVCAEAKKRYPGLPIMVSVLRTNPALKWYAKRGFTTVAEHEDYVELERKA